MKDLTDEQLNIAICEWRGWRKDNAVNDQPYWTLASEVSFASELPSHILGIEALGNMHEAEKNLTEEQKRKQAWHLWLLLDPSPAWEHSEYETLQEWEMSLTDIVDCLSATARQRAIALLHVVNPSLFQ